MRRGFSVHGAGGWLLATFIARSSADAQRAAGILFPGSATKISPCPIAVARSALAYWAAGETTDYAADLTLNAAWENL